MACGGARQTRGWAKFSLENETAEARIDTDAGISL